MKVRRRRKTAAADQGLWKYNVSETVHLFHGVLQVLIDGLIVKPAVTSLSCLLQYGSEQPRNVFCDVMTLILILGIWRTPLVKLMSSGQVYY